MKNWKIISSCLVFCISKVSAAALEPANGQLLFGAWLDTSNATDSMTSFSSRMGFNPSFFQLAQQIPLDFNNPPPVNLVDQLGPNVPLLLTGKN